MTNQTERINWWIVIPLSSVVVAFLTLLTLKLTGLIAWSWTWITAPLWGSVVLAGAVIAVFVVVLARRDAAEYRHG